MSHVNANKLSPISSETSSVRRNNKNRIYSNADEYFQEKYDTELKRQGITFTETKEKSFKNAGLTHPNKLPVGPKDDATSKEAFMTLLVTQLKCQNPLNPEEGKDFVAQLAQLNSVEQLQNLNEGIGRISDSFKSSRILEATGMIGKEMAMPTNTIQLTSHQEGDKRNTEKVDCYFDIPRLGMGEEITNFNVTITDSHGDVVASYQLENQAVPGRRLNFAWDGKYADGNIIRKNKDGKAEEIADGRYKISARMLTNMHHEDHDNGIPIDTMVNTKINSVSVTNTGDIRFIANGVGSIGMDDLKEISDTRQVASNLQPLRQNVTTNDAQQETDGVSDDSYNEQSDGQGSGI